MMLEPTELQTGLASFGDLLFPEEAAEPILAKPVRAALLEWLMEIWASKELEAVGLKARRRALFHGVPGTGKTTLAHHIAARLGLPLLVVRAERLQASYIGESARQVGKLFDALKRHGNPLFVFFDEFDSLAAKRMHGGRNSTGEQDHNHTINVLLANFDRYDGFIVAATNFADQVDEALWRRFEIQIELALPGELERQHILARYLAPFVLPEPALASLAIALEGATPALMRQFAEHIKRQIVVGPKADWDMGRDAVIARVISTVKPHPAAGLPRLWSLGDRDRSLVSLPWPLQTSLDAYPVSPSETGASASVVSIRRGKP